MIDQTLASLNDPTLARSCCRIRGVSPRILGVSLVVTAVIAPVLFRRERRLRAARAERLPDAGAEVAG